MAYELDSVEIDGVKGLRLIRSGRVYEDIQFAVDIGKVPASNAPTWEAFTTNTSEYAFDIDDYIDLQSQEMPHWWDEGTELEAHVHITNKTAQATGADRFVKLTLYLAYADGGAAWTEHAALSAELTIPTGTAAKTNHYLSVASFTWAVGIGTQVKARIKRIAATGGTEYADDVYFTQVGLHAIVNSMGSIRMRGKD